MNKQETKYTNTAVLMDEALIKLLNTKTIDYITVKEICQVAGVNRSTFYLHYESINDLLEEVAEYINQKFLAYFEKNNDFISNINTLPLEELDLINDKYLKPYLTFIKDNKKVFQASFNNPINMKSIDKYSSLEKHIITPILDRFDIPVSTRKYLVGFYLNGIIAIIKIWLEDDCKESIIEIEKMIINCVKK